MDTASVRDVAILEEDTPADIVEMLGQLRFHKHVGKIELTRINYCALPVAKTPRNKSPANGK